ncbi:MAG: hypothetical protein E7147_06030 [Rikenellaceae bacterium]|nr:hypothetical protein [Rikenellaceae bacterium]
MKKYLLAVLALGATMMMACEPANKEGNEPEVTPDFVVNAESEYSMVQGIITPYGDYYEVGAANYYLELACLVSGEDGMPMQAIILALDYSLAADNVDGLGTVKADVLNPTTEDYSYAPGTYVPGFVRENFLVGSGIMIQDYTTNTITNYVFVHGDITVSKAGDVYSVKGLVTCEDGKVVKLNYEGALVFYDEEGNSGIAPLKKGIQLKK